MSDKRRRGLWGALTADPWRKLLAITLAVMSWFLVDSRITRTLVRTVPLEFVGPRAAAGAPTDRLAVALPTDRVRGVRFLDGEVPITHVEVRITGPRFRVTDLESKPLDLQLTSFLGLDWRARERAEFTAEELGGTQMILKDLRIELQPARITAEVQSFGQVQFTLSTNNVEIVAGALDGRLLTDTAQFSPETAVVRGPAAELDKLAKRGGRIFRATMTGTDRQARAQVELIDADELALTPPPQLTMRLRPILMKVDLELPIVVDDLALPEELRGLYRPETPTRKVAILAGGDLRSRLTSLQESADRNSVRDFAMENLRLHVHIERLEHGAILGPQIERKARLVLHGRLASTVERNECLLADLVVVILRRAP